MKPLYLLVLAAAAGGPCRAEPVFYGDINIGLSYQRAQGGDDLSVSSTGSHAGMRGVEDVGDTLRGIWQLETRIDVTGEATALATGNSYAGLEANYGQISAGVHDTPFNKFREKISLFENTIGDSRSVLGAGSGVGNLMDVRARNMVRYQSPRMMHVLTGTLMYSSGNHDDTVSGRGGVDDSAYELTSLSLVARLGPIYGGAAWESQSLPASAGGDRSGLRLGARVRYAEYQAGVIYERLHAEDLGVLQRSAYLLNLARQLGNDAELALQLLHAGNYAQLADSGVHSLTLAFSHRVTRWTQVSIQLSRIRNSKMGAYTNVLVDGDNSPGTAGGGYPSATIAAAGISYQF